MKSSLFFLCLFVSFLCHCQLKDSFADGNFTDNPVWSGTDSNFKVNAGFVLQSAAVSTSTSWLFTPSVAIEQGEWNCSFRIDYPTSSANYACMYLIADTVVPSLLNGYYVMVGGTPDEVSLFRKQGNVKVKLIDGADKRTDGKKPEIEVKVTRDSVGVFRLYSKRSDEQDFFPEGEARDESILSSAWFGLSYSNTSTTGSCYFFDDIQVSGRPVTSPPAGLVPGEICFNELMFHAADSAVEYVEVYNRSERILNLSRLTIALRRNEGSMTTVTAFPAGVCLEPGACMAITADSAQLAGYHLPPDTARIVEGSKWTTLNNEEAALLLVADDGSTVLDSVHYSADWHHVLMYNPAGVALEKMHPDLSSSIGGNWHSAAAAHRYGSPGFRNSQYRSPGENTTTFVSLAQEWFSPDNDGVNDRCIIHYSMPEPGYLMRLTICSPDGAVWLVLTQGELLSTEGILSWDGQNSEGKISNPGVYILVAEVYHPEKGVTKCRKLPVLLTIR